MTRAPIVNFITVPHHPGRDLARPLTFEILKEIELSHDEFIKLLKKI